MPPDVIEYAVKNQMRLLVQEKQILNDIANSVNVEVKGQVTTIEMSKVKNDIIKQLMEKAELKKM